MIPNDEAICGYYAALFAAHTADHVYWTGTSWSRAGAPLTSTAVFAALLGAGPSLSGYMQTPGDHSMTHVAAIDFDADDGWSQAVAVRDAMTRKGVAAYLEPSRRGGHLWLTLDAVTPARVVRRALRGFLDAAGVAESPKTELRPAFDTVKDDGFGYPLRMPTMPNPKTGRRYPLIAPDDTVLPGRLDHMLLSLVDTPATIITDMAERTPPRLADLPPTYAPPRPIQPDGPVESISGVLMSVWGAPRAVPGRSIRCPAHPDTNPSLSIADDDERVFCKSPSCVLWNEGRGRGPAELRKLATSR